MDPRSEVTRILEQNGAILKRDKNHEVWQLANGKQFVRAKTPSDVRSDQNNLADLKRLLGQQPSTVPLKPPIAKQQVSSNGGQQSGPRKVERVLITPDQAKSWLELNVRNRPMIRRIVEEYASDMLNGRWLYNYQPIMFDRDNTLVDGQHRLAAVVASGVSIKSDVVFDCDPGIMNTVDIGAKRTAAQQLTLTDIPHAAGVAAIATFLLNYESGHFTSKDALSRPRVLQYVSEHVDELTESARHVAAGWKLMPMAIAGSMRVVFSRLHKPKAEEFFHLLLSGEELTASSPIYRLRERLIADRASTRKMPRHHVVALVIKAWNAWITGDSADTIRYRDSDNWPVPVDPANPPKKAR